MLTMRNGWSVICTYIVQMLRKQHSSGERRHGKKDRQPSPEPVTYALMQSLSLASYAIGHALSSHIAAYVPVTGVLKSTNCLRPVTSRLALVCWTVVDLQVGGEWCNCLFCLYCMCSLCRSDVGQRSAANSVARVAKTQR